jgi:hypothetical protein
VPSILCSARSAHDEPNAPIWRQVLVILWKGRLRLCRRFYFFLFLPVSASLLPQTLHVATRTASQQTAWQTVTQLLLLCNSIWRVMQHFVQTCFIHKFQLTVNLLLRHSLNGKFRYWSASVSELNKNCWWPCYTFLQFLGPAGRRGSYFNSALTSLCTESEPVYLKWKCCNLHREHGEFLLLTS